ncbi:MAG: hypothetical protein ACI3ZD_02935 [Prevotella sp.]
MKQTGIASSITDANYKQWIVDIEKRFRQQQVKAAIHINSDKTITEAKGLTTPCNRC